MAEPREPQKQDYLPGLMPPRGGALRRRGIYLLPNLFTTAALFAGFYAIVQAMNGRFGESAIAIFVAGLLDGLDGRVARLTRTQSEFGKEYDSLSDMVSFGAALRLARFNVMIDVVDKRYFQGLPSPAAAALVAGFVWLAHDNKIPLDAYNLQWVAAFVALYGGLTMVSNVPFYSFKDINFRKSVPFWAMLLIVLGFVLVSSDPPIVLFLLFCAYGLSGYVMWALGKRPRPRP